MDLFADVETIWLLVRLFVVLTVFGFVRNWTNNTTIALVVGGVLCYLFVFQYPLLGVGYIILSHIFVLIFFIWVMFMIIPK
jgi:O-antigen/teichoic acid export membrane protein